MSNYESIVVIEDWISEHYFTSDGKGTTFQKHVTDLRKEWDADAKNGNSTVLKRFNAAKATLQTQLASLPEFESSEIAGEVSAVYQMLRDVLGFSGQPEPLTFERGVQDHVISGLWLGDTKDVLWLDGTPAGGDDAFSESRLLNTKNSELSDIAQLSMAKLVSELYQCDPAPKYIVVAIGSFLFLTEAERWPEGRYLAANVQLVADRNDAKKGGEIDRFLSIFARQSIAPAADGTIWWDARLEESRQHAVGVSKDLRDGIRESIEIIANDVLRRRISAGLNNEVVNGQELARQSLRFLYRILFLLYAEASPELGVLPKGAGEYDNGYGLDRLRELVQVELASHQSQVGTHLFESLNLLFELVNGNHRSQATSASVDDQIVDQDNEELEENQGLSFEALEADLFSPTATSLINDAKLGNAELQRVLERLLLSKAGAKGDRGFISYANLGINQLGAVYEGLMSYTGFIAQEDLREVAKNGDASKGSWVVPIDRADAIDSKHFVKNLDEHGIPTAILHPKGSFVYRLAGRERQQSASYYTPEVLTKFVVSQALEELLTEDVTPDEILELNVCEPALGSGAFAIEAVRQLADEYLKRKQIELGREIPADEYPQELQRVKAQLALHNVHGVDLNSTAVELAEVSLWLDTMQPGLSAPWFGMRLKQGNSLVGARRATYSVDQIKGKKYLNEEPQANPLTGLAEALKNDMQDPAVYGKVHHFLLPGEGWGAAADAKEVKDLTGDAQKKLKEWAKSTRLALNKTQITRLQAIAERVEVLWQVALRRLEIASSEARRFVDYWPHEREAESTLVTRAEIEHTLADPDGAYRRLQRAMNAWNALWFWPLTEEGIQPPTIEQWINGLEALLGKPIGADKKAGRKSGLSSEQGSILSNAGWEDLRAFEEIDFPIAQMKSKSVLDVEHPWLAVCDRIASEQGFFHWELEFGAVFAKGGFDVQVGNPPWVRPDWDEKSVYAEFDPWWLLDDKPLQSEKLQRKAAAHENQTQRKFMTEMASGIVSLRSFLTSPTNYPIVGELRADLYRSFMERTWMSASVSGVVSLIHPGSHFTEKRAGNLRSATYRRLRRHWDFRNKMKLFEELTDQLAFGVHVYGRGLDAPRFVMAASLFVPQTVVASMKHDGTGRVPAQKMDDGTWDLRGHRERIVEVNLDVLKTWASLLDDPGTSPWNARMVYPTNRASMSVLELLSKFPRIRELDIKYSSGWNETTHKRKGFFEERIETPNSWNDVIIQGPHFGVANPFAKRPRSVVNSNNDWDEVDLESLTSGYVPRTTLQPVRHDETIDVDSGYGTWEMPDGSKRSVRRFPRLAIREYVGSVTGNRTLQPAVIPIGAAHINAVNTYGFPNADDSTILYELGGILSSILLDSWVRMRGAGHVTKDAVLGLPLPRDNRILPSVAQRFSKLSPLMPADFDLLEINAYKRWQLTVEIDVLVALMAEVTIEELCTVYRTQFSVAVKSARETLYDIHGRKVPAEVFRRYLKLGEKAMSLDACQWRHPQSGIEYTFEPPFRSFDREDDMRVAYEKFSRMLKEHGEIIEEEV